LQLGRYGAIATLLPGGTVMIAGGCVSTCGPATATTDIYEGGYFVYGPSMTQPRLDQTATLMADGDLLVSGGGTSYCCSDTRTAEVLTSILVKVQPGSAPPGGEVTVSGSGFYAGEPVQVTIDFAPIGEVTTGSDGTFVLHAKIPSTEPSGSHTIGAFGQSSFATGQTTITVT
jgi:hypothetical protein